MERDISYDEAISPKPEKGTVLLLEGPGHQATYESETGISFNFAKDKLLQLDPLDGPVRLEQWGAGGGIAYDGRLGDDPSTDPTAVPTSDGGTHLYGLMPDGRRVFTSPLSEILQFGPGTSPLAFVVDGLVFELGTADPAWVQAAENESEADIALKFMRSYAPLNTHGWKRGGLQ